MSAPNAKILTSAELTDKICVIVGTRPSFIKHSPLIRALQRRRVPFFVVHTGQHYSPEMDRAFFDDLGLPEPQFRLDSVQNQYLHGAQTAEMMVGTERILLEERPRLVLVGGDTNTNLAAALAARKLRVPVGHVEAGMRCYDWRIPEEHNRVMIDHISELLFAPSDIARRNLEAERVLGTIHVVGNTLVDAVRENVAVAATRSRILENLGLERRSYAAMTLHREENIDDPAVVQSILKGVADFSRSAKVPVIYPAHPRSQERLHALGLSSLFFDRCIRIVNPLGYLDFLQLLANSRLFLTDSGGAQQEACMLGVPCITLRERTEWIETLDIGANVIAGTQSAVIAEAAKSMLDRQGDWSSPFGEPGAADRILDISLLDIPIPQGPPAAALV